MLDFRVGTRALGMGEAYTAQADDVSSLFWNPAGLGIMNQSQAAFLYNDSVEGLSFSHAALAVPFEYGGIGASLSYLSYGTITGYDSRGLLTSDVRANSMAGTLGAGWYGGPISLGVNAKMVREALADFTATGAAFDAGLTWTCQQPVAGATLRLATVLRNMGPGLQFIQQRDPLPREWRLGAALVQAWDRRLNFSFDLSKPRDLPWAPYAGGEYWVVPSAALRLGYAGSRQEGSGLRAGLGLRVKDLQFDYAYSGLGDLGMANYFELSLRFGPLVPRLNAEERALYRRAKRALARGRFEEATLLFDSLDKLEPNYRPFKSRLRLALAGALKTEETSRQTLRRLPLLSPVPEAYEDGMTQAELEKLLAESETNEGALAERTPPDPSRNVFSRQGRNR